MEQDPTVRFSSFLSQLTPDITPHLADYYADSIHFTDPINEGHGLGDLKAIFEDLFKQLKDIQFDILHSHGDQQSAFLRWNMHYKFRGRSRQLQGISHLTFGDDGKVTSQQDFWDTARGLYNEFPLLNASLKAIRKIVRVRPK